MTDCKPRMSVAFRDQAPVEVRFDAPHISSDGGLLLLRQIDDRLGLTARIAACIPDERDPAKVEHPRHEQVQQRVFQILGGYEDCNDADSLRNDPMFKAVCGRDTNDGMGLSSQPTLSRFENVMTGRSIRQAVEVLEDDYVARLAPDTQRVILDVDSTDDPTHGAQQLSFFHGYYDQHMYHPVLVFDGEGQLVTARLRPGNAHGARGATSLLTGLIRRIKKRFPVCHILVRGDSAFSLPKILDRLEQLDRELGDVDYVIGIGKNDVLLRHAKQAMDFAAQLFADGVKHVRHFTSTTYAAKTWSEERHVVIKAEYTEQGANTRFVVTSLRYVEPRALYDVAYCGRGECENRIKDFKNALMADRLSCSRFVPNFFRLILHTVAYRLMYELRLAAKTVGSELGSAQMDTLRLRLIKVAAQVTQSVRRILIRLPRSFPLTDLFAAIAGTLMPAPA